MHMEPWDPLAHPPLIQSRKQESDSDEEGGLGNVTRVVIRPPGHSGKAKRGHLSFDASFEGGNLGRVDFISDFEYDLFLRPDTCNPRFRFWFNFVVDNVSSDQRVVFNIVNLCKTKTLYRVGMTPIVRTSSRPKWQRLDGKYVFYHKSPEHRHHYVLSFAFTFDNQDDVYQFAMSFPYSYSRLQTHLQTLINRGLPFLKHSVIANSLANRPLDLLIIGDNPMAGTLGKNTPNAIVPSNSNSPTPIMPSMVPPSNTLPNIEPTNSPTPNTMPTNTPTLNTRPTNTPTPSTAPPSKTTPTPTLPTPSKRRTKVVFIMARIHAGGTPTSYIAQGLIDFLVSSHPIAACLREYCLVQVVPMVNPDGVFMGNYRSNLMGHDLNRVWNQCSPWAHPTIYAIKAHLLNMTAGAGAGTSNQKKGGNRSSGVDLDLVIDLHAHSSLLGTFVYGNSYEDVYRFERHILFPKLLAHNCAEFSHAQTMYNRDTAKNGTARRHLCDILPNHVNVYAIHASLFGAANAPTETNTAQSSGSNANASGVIPYTEEAYFRLGRNLGRTLFDYYKATGIIPQTVLVPPILQHQLPSTSGGGLVRKHKKQLKQRLKHKKHTINLQTQSSNNDQESTEEEDGCGLSDSDSASNSSSASSNGSKSLHHRRRQRAAHVRLPVSTGAGASSSVIHTSSSVSASLLMESLITTEEESHQLQASAGPFGMLRFGRARTKEVLPTKLKTFDFSCLSKSLKRDLMERRREVRLFGQSRKKVGGGGIIVRPNNGTGYRRKHKKHSTIVGRGGNELGLVLTIIDLGSELKRGGGQGQGGSRKVYQRGGGGHGGGGVGGFWTDWTTGTGTDEGEEEADEEERHTD